MRKSILFFIVVVFLTGCSAVYNVEITPSGIYENIDVFYNKTEVYAEGLTSETMEKELVHNDPYSNEYYNNKLTKTDSGYIFNYTYNHNFESFRKVRNAAMCYDSFSITETKNIATIITSDKFKCIGQGYYDITEVKINIKTDYKVVENNADYINDNTYTWVVNKENFANRPIKFSYDTTNEIPYKKNFDFYINMMMFVGIVLISGLGIFGFFYFKNKKANQM